MLVLISSASFLWDISNSKKKNKGYIIINIFFILPLLAIRKHQSTVSYELICC